MQSRRFHFHPKREKTWGQHKNRDLQVREQACCLLSEKLKVYKTVEKNHVSCDDFLQLCLVMALHVYENFHLITKSQKKWQTPTSGCHRTARPAHSVIAYIWHVPDDSLEKSSHLHGLEIKNNYWTLATMEFGESVTLGHIKIFFYVCI